MIRLPRTPLLFIMVCSWVASALHGQETSCTLASETTPRNTTSRLGAASFGKLPLAFVENHGQFDERVLFMAQHRGMTAYFTRGAFVLDLVRHEATVRAPSRTESRLPTHVEPSCDEAITKVGISLSFEGASSNVVVDGIDPLPGRYHYFLGSDPSRWRTNVRGYSSIRYRGLYPGVDVVVREQESQFEYDLILAPGADLDQVVMRCDGADALRIDASGTLVIETAVGPIEQHRPRTYHIGPAGECVQVDCSFRVLDATHFGFHVTGRHEDLPLVVDPGLAYSTLLGGRELDAAQAVAIDGTGAVVVCGYTESRDFPTRSGAYDRSFNGGTYDAFVARLDASGSTLIDSTFLGGSGDDRIVAFALDAAGSAFVTGDTSSANFPTTPGAYDTTFNGGSVDAFVAKLDASGGMLLYSTFLGGSQDGGLLDEGPRAIALDAGGAAVVTGFTYSTDFPTTPGAYDTRFDGIYNAFVAKVDPSGTTLVYSTLLGAWQDFPYALALDGTGAAVVTGITDTPTFPTTPGAYDTTFNGDLDGFVAKLDPSGSALVYSTFLGGSDHEEARLLALDTAGDAVVIGFTKSDDFPTTPGTYDTTHVLSDNYDLFVTKLDASGSTLLYSTYLGGEDFELPGGFALDDTGATVVSGTTWSADFPTTPGAYDTTQNGVFDVFVTKLDPFASKLLYSTYLGASSSDAATGLALDASGAAVLCGATYSTDFPTTPGAYDTTFNGNQDGYVAKLEFCLASTRGYGSGWPGTLGVPALASSGPPVLCTPISIAVGNSRGTTTAAAFVVGFQPASIPTALGGTLLVVPSLVAPFTLPAAGASVPYVVLCGDEFCGLRLYSQVLELDPGASQGVSFTPGLELIHGR